jgi:acyl transferase domain-containing protein
MFISTSNLHMLSLDGHCKMWDAGADGYARGEGGGIFVLKRQPNAQTQGDSIECLIRATVINSDGRTPEMTMPSATSQIQLIQRTFRTAALDSTLAIHRCQYFEAHGAGTQAGDKEEAEAINAVFCTNEQ